MILKDLYRKLFGGETASIFRGMATLVMGSGIGRLVGIANIPILTRIYSPEDFGALSVYVALVSILIPLLTLRYAQAIPLPRSDGAAVSLMTISLMLVVVFSSLLMLLLGCFGPLLLSWLSMEVIAPWWWLIVAGALGGALYETLSMWATRLKAYRTIALTQFTQSLMGESTKLVMGLLAVQPLGLLIGHFLSQSAGVTTYISRLNIRFWQGARRLRIKRLTLIMKYYADFPVYRMPSQLMVVLASKLPLILTAKIYGMEVTGQLGLALMALGLPVTLIANSAGKSFFAESAEIGKKNTAKLLRITKSVIKRMAIIAFFPALFMLLFGDILFVLLFGNEWALSGRVASVLSIYLFFNFLSNPIQYIFSLMERNIIYLQLSFQRIILVSAVFAISWLYKVDFLNCIGMYAAILCIHYLIVSARAIELLKGSKSTDVIS